MYTILSSQKYRNDVNVFEIVQKLAGSKFVSGIATLAETFILRKIGAAEHIDDTDEEQARKRSRAIFLRTLTACDGFTIAILNIFLGVFVDSF